MCDACAKEAERCSYCGWVFDDNGDCNCPPEGYIKPGTETLMYVNAYAVTRHYGGPEEGGWWYNHREPIASIPIRAIVTDKHPCCYACGLAEQGLTNKETGKPYQKCKWAYSLEEKDVEEAEKFKLYLEELYADVKEGNIYSVLGGTKLFVCIEDEPGEEEPKGRPHYE